MNIKIPEKNKKPGVSYAVSDDGIELPVIDITHPLFAFEVSPEELSALIDSMQRSAKIPPSVLQGLAQKSILVRGMVESADTFTTGMMTYLNKIAPAVLGEGYSGDLDRQWATSLTPLTFRWRMRDVARLLADELLPLLERRGDVPLHMLNIGGGPAVDSLNALILLQKEQPQALAGRSICIHVLDIDREGPNFGRRALAALMEDGAALHGLDARFEYTPYNWLDPTVLQDVATSAATGKAIMAGSSEGALFEYAPDEVIIANLKVLHVSTPADFVMVGPVVRDATTLDPRLKDTQHVEGRPAIRYIGLEPLRRLAASAGWVVKRTLDGPMHQVSSLIKA